MKIGLVGLGKMGRAMAGRLAVSGHAVIGWDADPAARDWLDTAGHDLAASPAEVARAADTVISVITDDHGVRRIFEGAEGFLSTSVSGKLFVEMSTVQPKTAQALAPRVAAVGAGLIDSPVMGTIPAAEAGTLLALVGGRDEDVARARPVHEALTREARHLGPAGSGYSAKLCVNLMMASYLQSLAEALSLGTRAGVDIEDLLDILQQAPVASPWLKNKLPFLRGGEGAMTLDIRSIRKDVLAAIASGADLGVTMPGAAAVASALSASVAQGEGEADLARHARLFMERMGQDPRVR